MLINVFIIEKMIGSKPIQYGLETQLEENYYIICLDADKDPYQFCREHFYIMYVKPYKKEIVDYKYDPIEWRIELILIGNSLWTFILVQKEFDE